MRKSETKIGARLRQAIRQWRTGSIREFQRGMSVLGAPRSTYPTINSYLKDESEPPPSFVTAAAKILGVRQEWLAFGTGQRTERDEKMARLADAARDINHPGYQAVMRALPELDNWSVVAHAAFIDTVVARAESAPNQKEVTPELYAELARDIMTILSAPTQLWGIYEDPTPKETDQYAVAMLNALRLAIPEPAKGTSVTEYVPARSVLVEWLTFPTEKMLDGEEEALWALTVPAVKREIQKAKSRKRTSRRRSKK